VNGEKERRMDSSCTVGGSNGRNSSREPAVAKMGAVTRRAKRAAVSPERLGGFKEFVVIGQCLKRLGLQLWVLCGARHLSLPQYVTHHRMIPKAPLWTLCVMWSIGLLLNHPVACVTY
jgi:hypothetical protein